MNKVSNVLMASLFVVVLAPKNTPDLFSLESDVSQKEALNIIEWKKGPAYKFHRNGKKLGNSEFSTIYSQNSLDQFKEFPKVDNNLLEGLDNSLKLLKYRKNKTKSFDGLSISPDQTKKTIELIKEHANDPAKLLDVLNAYQIAGKDQKGNVLYTGYFTPVVKVSKTKDKIYKYPIYDRPNNWEGKLPSRKEIEKGNAFLDLGLELAYAKDPVELYFMQVQGSGIVEYRDGKHELFSYNGGNGHPYKSIGKFMVDQDIALKSEVSIEKIKRFINENPEMQDSILFANPNYIFFNPLSIENKTTGAGLVPLTPEYSIAVDTDYIPLGSCLLGAVPVYNRKGVCTHHEYKILLAHDVGGAINGPGHVDVYEGIGKDGRYKATRLHHYGALWLLLPPGEGQDENIEILRAGI